MREWTWTARRRWSIGCACFYHFCHSEALCAERMSLRVGIVVVVVVSRYSCSMNVMLIRSSRVGRLSLSSVHTFPQELYTMCTSARDLQCARLY